MEMCYEGAMSLPSSYVTMNEEEMTYVEGGAWSVKKVWYNIVGAAGQWGVSTAYAVYYLGTHKVFY